MKITFDDLKSAYKSHIKRRVPLSREGCPSPENILSVFESSASFEDKERVVNHLAGCSYCTQEFELCRGLFREQGKALEDMLGWLRKNDRCAGIRGKRSNILASLSGPRVQGRPLWKLAVGFLSAAVLIGLSFIGVKLLVTAPELRERGRLPGQVHLISPVEGEKIKFPPVFRWEGTPGAEYYNLEIFDRTLLPLWKSPRIEGLRYELPPDAAKFIKKDEVYFWTITAWLKDGMKRDSPLEEFTLSK
jgi:hypothetical protein